MPDRSDNPASWLNDSVSDTLKSHQGTSSMTQRKRFPRAIDPTRVGDYPALAKAGGGYVWDAVLEYRVWCSPRNGAPDEAEGNDYYFAFPSYPEAVRFAEDYEGAEEPIALILQREYIDEPTPGEYVHIRKERITEWPIEFLSRPRRTDRTIAEFLSSDAPHNRLDILRGLARRKSR